MNKLPRDVFIESIFEAAKINRDIYFLNADLGAQALDIFREELPEQFIHVGISEQNMIDVAAGLALEGKTVYVYAMAPFVSLRCFEQIKVTLASMNLPVTIIAVGVGWSYAPAGPTHYATEDISCMRSLANIEIYNPCDTQAVKQLAALTYNDPKLRYVRLDRQALADIYTEGQDISAGLVEIKSGKELCIVSHGNMLEPALELAAELTENGLSVGVVDAYRIKPLSNEVVTQLFSPYSAIVVWEEHFLSGGLGSVITEVLADALLLKPVLRVGIEDHYYLENGNREQLHKLAGIDFDSVKQKVLNYVDKINAK